MAKNVFFPSNTTAKLVIQTKKNQPKHRAIHNIRLEKLRVSKGLTKKSLLGSILGSNLQNIYVDGHLPKKKNTKNSKILVGIIWVLVWQRLKTSKVCYIRNNARAKTKTVSGQNFCDFRKFVIVILNTNFLNVVQCLGIS